MLSNVNDLAKRHRRESVIKDFVDHNLEFVNAEIEKQHAEGFSNLSVEISTLFEVPGMRFAESAVAVVADIVVALRQAGYTVYIKLSDDKRSCALNIGWVSEDDIKRQQARQRIIDSHLRKN
jgi:hypothetical protein